MEEVSNIIRILKETRIAINENNPFAMKKLSDQTIHSASIYQDSDNIIVAVLVYSLSKIIQRDHYKEMTGWNEFYNNFIKNIDLAIKALEKNDLIAFRTCIGRIRSSVEKISGNLKDYIRDVFYKAELNKASKIYEHGISLEQTATLLGVSLWDLSSYVGQSTMIESRLNQSMPIKKRIKIAEDIFGK